MTLANQLDELALANSQGLLNDDEYRLLRQDLFERYSNNTLLPAQLLPTGSGRKPSLPYTSHHAQVDDVHLDNHKSRGRHKIPFTAGVSSLFKRATGFNVKAQPSPSSSSSSSVRHDPPRPSTAPASGQIPKRGVKPLLHKASEFFVGRLDNKRFVSPAVISSPPTSPRLSDIRNPSSPPFRPSKRTAIPTFPSNQVQAPTNIFDDRNLNTSKDIRAAIIATEAEAQRLRDAFNNLESTTSFRVHQQLQEQQQQQRNARRLHSAAAPEQHVNVLMDGADWRHHRPPIHSPLSALHNYSDRKGYHYQHVHIDSAAVNSNNDGASVRSGSSSMETSLSRSKSISSLRNRQQQQPHPGSPLSAKFPQSILRKNSVSSISSQAHSARRLAVTPGASSSWSRSTGHLPLGMLVEGDANQGHPSSAGIASPEVTEIQRRKAEVMARYVARIEYLKAKLNSVERQEKLLRR